MARKKVIEEEHRSLARPTAKAIFWVTLTRGIKAPLTLVAVAILARILTPAEYGIVAIGMIVATFSDTLIDGSFGMVLIQRKEITPSVIGAALALSATLAIVFAAGIAIFASEIEREFNFPHLREVLLYLAAMLPVTAITTVTSSLLQRALRLRILTLIGLFSQIVYIVAAVALALAGMGIWSLVWAQMLQWAIDAVFEVLAVRKHYTVSLSVEGIRDVVGIGGMFTVSRMVKWAANSADRIFVGRFLGAADLGLYSRGATLMRTARQLAGAGPMRVLFSSFSKMQHDPPRMLKAYHRSLSLSLTASVLVAAFVVVNGDLIVKILLGPQWYAAIPVIQILFVGFVPKSAALVAETIPLAFGLGRTSAVREGVQLVLVGIGAMIGAQFGVVGAATGVCIAYWLFYLVCLILVQSLLHPKHSETLRMHANSLLAALLPTALSAATLWLLPSRSLLLEFLPAIVFGLATLFVLAFGPAGLVTDDVVLGRSHIRDRLLRRFPALARLGTGRA